MGKFDGILICSDFDGTLGTAGQISKENRDAISYFQENGGLFTIVSGRNPMLLHEWLTEIGMHVNAPLVGYNGAWIIDPESKQTLFSGGRNDFAAIELLVPFWNRDGRILELLPHSTPTWIPRCKRSVQTDTPEKLIYPESLPLYNVLALTACEEDAIALRDELIEAAGDRFEIARSWATGIEVINPHDRKGVAIRRVQQMTGAHTIVTVGDYENDHSMIKEADIGYAVANAIDSIKAVADRHTVDFREHAIAAIVRDLEERGI